MGLTIVDDIVNAIETGRPPKCTGEDGRQALEIAIALRESHRRGGVKVNLPLEDRKLQIMASESLYDNVPGSQFIAHLPYLVRKITFLPEVCYFWLLILSLSFLNRVKCY